MNLNIYRSTVMMIMKIINPIAVERRRKRRLQRRVYQNKVHAIIIFAHCQYNIVYA